MSDTPPGSAALPADTVECYAGMVHDAHLWTFADDHPLMQCPGVSAAEFEASGLPARVMEERPPALPVIFGVDAMAYGYFTVRQHDDGRLEAVGEVPARCAFSRDLLESAEHPAVTWDGKRITVTLANGSWLWDAEGRNVQGNVIYGGPTSG